jgi:thiamine transport system permease protein
LGLSLADSPLLLIVGNMFFNLCLLVRGAMGGLSRVSASRLAAARSLGATPWRAFWRLEWPTARSAVAASACLVFLYCLTGFGLALLLGGARWATAEVEIYTLVAYDLELGAASVLALWMLLLAGVVVGLYAWLVVRGRDRIKADTVPLQAVHGWRTRAGVAGALAVLLVFSYGPLLALLWRAAAAGSGAWAHAWSASAWLALGNTLRFCAMGLTVAGVLGVLHGLVGARSAAWRALGMVPLVVSPVMVAFGLLLLWPAYLDSLAVLVCAYALLAMPLVAAPVAQAVQTLPQAWLEAARTLGATPSRVFWRVVWPHVAPSVRRGLAFAAATMLGEFAVTLLLSRPEWLTLSTYVYQLLGRPGELNAQAAWVMSSVLMALSLLAFLVIEPHTGKGEQGA